MSKENEEIKHTQKKKILKIIFLSHENFWNRNNNSSQTKGKITLWHKEYRQDNESKRTIQEKKNIRKFSYIV